MKQEYHLREQRPEDLPVPAGEGSEELEVIEDFREQRAEMQKGRDSSRGRTKDRFQTLESGSTGMQSAAKRSREERRQAPHEEGDPEMNGEGSHSGRVGLQTEGGLPSTSRVDEMEEQEMDSLQRALENDLVEQLRRENLQLKKEMDELRMQSRMSQSGPSVWSEVVEEEEKIQPPPPPRSPKTERVAIITMWVCANVWILSEFDTSWSRSRRGKSLTGSS